MNKRFYSKVCTLLESLNEDAGLQKDPVNQSWEDGLMNALRSQGFTRVWSPENNIVRGEGPASIFSPELGKYDGTANCEFYWKEDRVYGYGWFKIPGWEGNIPDIPEISLDKGEDYKDLMQELEGYMYEIEPSIEEIEANRPSDDPPYHGLSPDQRTPSILPTKPKY